MISIADQRETKNAIFETAAQIYYESLQYL